MSAVRDLSERHGPLTDRYAPDDAHDALELSAASVESFSRDGYVTGIRVLHEDAVEELQNELDAILASTPARSLFHEYHDNESGDPERVLIHALGAWRIAPAFHDLLWNPRILVPASQLLDGAVRLWHDQLFVKPPHRGGEVAWHQDYSYWTRTTPMAHLTCWIPLDDVDDGTGSLEYVPGSHHWDLLPVTGLATDMNAIESVLTPEQRAAFQPVALQSKRGVASFHHPLMVHGSRPNRSAKPRRAVALNFCLDGTLSATDEPLLEGVPAIPSRAASLGPFLPAAV